MSSQTDIAAVIQQTPLVDTHEHMRFEADYLDERPDILCQLFQNYVHADLFVAGASQEALDSLFDPSDPDVAARFAPIQEAWARVQHTGYGEAVRIIAKDLYGIDSLTPDTIAAAQEKNAALVQPGERLRLLGDEANLDHIQTDAKSMTVLPDMSGPDFFFYDISWVDFCSGRPNHEEIAQHTGLEVSDLHSLKRVMETIFAKSFSPAIAVKSQHAYNRTLRWEERSDAEAAKALDIYLRDGEALDEAARLCLGDWCWARGVELCIDHDLPMKIHTGYYAGHSRMPVDYIRSGNLCPLLAKYPDARFVLMHIAYPYTEELVALAKHYPNVYADLCWAWSINPYSSMEFVRRFIHAAPANKLFLFGGDTGYPGAALAYAKQARNWFTRVMQDEISDGLLTEAQAIDLSRRFMRDNQYECFRVEAKKQILRAAAA
ncbi:MAG: amidohydrolase family protein [Caldilineaceae bacterium SB0670_bin_27]|uniref:Amidohydrolase family protein n=1 Tax=Caldilineaceae bacterium SB0664_bin_27 TaxID=2605260 RepID=A0A6B0YWB0_9CHLR|nr:amidohydrolase family protein [Caldilineaceae bacterium SB0664_bin_27]MYJ77322.1 amidohydrolase family protein [Caldilineaceae bacterium SB0670_bin_27]